MRFFYTCRCFVALLLFIQVSLPLQAQNAGRPDTVQVLTQPVPAPNIGFSKKIEVDSVLLLPALSDDPKQLLSGLLPGLFVTRAGGNPNQDFHIQLAGYNSANKSNTPLILIDGVPVFDLITLRQEDIASFQVLKSPVEAANYGAQAASGVVLIETKQAQRDQPTLQYSMGLSLERPAKVFQSLNEQEYLQYSSIDADPNTVHNTNWIDEIHQNGLSSTHYLRYQNAWKRLRIKTGLGYQQREGLQIHTGYRQYNSHFGIGYDLFAKKLQIDIDARAAHRAGQLGFSKANTSAYYFAPSYPVRDGLAANNYTRMPISTYLFNNIVLINPVDYLTENYNLKEQSTATGHFKLRAYPAKNLKLAAEFSPSFQLNEQGLYIDPSSSANILHGFSGVAGFSFLQRQQIMGAFSADYQIQRPNWQWAIAVNHRRTNDHFDYLGAFSANPFPPSKAINEVADIQNLDIMLNGFRQTVASDMRSNTALTSLKMAFLLQQKMNVQFTFAKIKHYELPLPAISMDYCMLKNSQHTLRLKTGWGVLVNYLKPDSGRSFVANELPFTTTYAFLGDNTERKTSIDAGVDYFNHWVHFSGSVYKSVTATQNDFERNFKLSNRGIDAQINFWPMKRTPLKWTIGLSYNAFLTKYRDLQDSNRPFGPTEESSGSIIITGGIVIHSNYPSLYREVNNKPYGLLDDGGIKTAVSLPKSALPRHSFGINSLFQYQRWKGHVLLRGALGHYLANEARYKSAYFPQALNRFKWYENETPLNPKWIERADFCRVEHLQVSYRLAGKFGGIELALGAQNLFTFTKYSGLDPEVRWTDQSYQKPEGILLQPFNPRPNPGFDRLETYLPTQNIYLKTTLSLQ